MSVVFVNLIVKCLLKMTVPLDCFNNIVTEEKNCTKTELRKKCPRDQHIVITFVLETYSLQHTYTTHIWRLQPCYHELL